MEEERTLCTCCGQVITNDYYSTVYEEPICDSCAENECSRCECCGDLVYDVDAYGSDYDRCLCESCFDEFYVHCDSCDDLIHRDDLHEYDDGYYCSRCYHEKTQIIRNYSYKPCPHFFGESIRYFGVELEIDKGGRDTDNAQELLEIVNTADEKRLYIKTDSSLDDGLELVTHPLSLDYHLHEFNWEDILKTAVNMGYRSHQTSTCGLHVHVNRDAFGDEEDEQEEVISRILYFVEHHWLEMVKFSRRTESALNRWAARHGYEPSPSEVMSKAKSDYGRYYAVNLCNHNTIEFRLFRGTLKLNTLLATLQLTDTICDVAVNYDDDELQALSWSEFVSHITYPELIQYLKERRLYINEETNNEEEI